ncbi:MAG: glutathione S-transferase family protein [Rhodospirillaceae bacterium]|nr:glutathione S-transferase family protein [Rhodospirillaceae bacterium]
MRRLYHHTLLPAARKVRLALHEKRLEFAEYAIEPWRRDDDLLGLNPSGDLPVLVDDDETVVCDHGAICEYLDEVYPEAPLFGRSPAGRAEARRLAAWFDEKFFREVTQHLAGEKLTRRVSANAAPDSRALKAGRENIHTHMQYIAWLTERRSWLAGDQISIADLSAAANLSLVDYIGDVPWNDHPLTKEWYVRVKSRPSFRCLLKDTIPGIPAAAVYADLDF